MQIAIPPKPWSPMPKIPSESVATTSSTSGKGTLARSVSMRPMFSVLTTSPRG